jgi:hypothetical protein
MKLVSQMDYSGTRRHAPDSPSSEEGSWLRRLGGRLAAWRKKKLDPALRPSAEQVVGTMWFADGKGRNFSLLGAEYDRTLRRPVAPCPFPEGEVRARRPIGYRTNAE